METWNYIRTYMVLQLLGIHNFTLHYSKINIISPTAVSQSKVMDERIHCGTVDNLTQNNRFVVGSLYSLFYRNWAHPLTASGSLFHNILQELTRLKIYIYGRIL